METGREIALRSGILHWTYLYINLAKEQVYENVSAPRLDYTSLSKLLSRGQSLCSPPRHS